MKNRCDKFIVGFLLLVLLLLRLPAQAHAQTVVDLDRRGSLTLRLKDLTTDEASADAEIRLYALAGLETEHGEMSYRWSEDYRDLAEAGEELSSATLAEQMAHRALDQALPLQSKTTGAEGELTFSDLELGLYLLIQTGGPDSHYPMEAFLLALPLTNEAGTAWLYDVTAYPKVEARPEAPLPTEPPTPSEPAGPRPTQPGRPVDGGLIITGASNWLVILLSVAGLSLLTLGWILRRRESQDVS